MKKAVEFLKRNKNALIVLALLAAFIIIAACLGGKKTFSVSGTNVSGANKTETELKLQDILSEIEGVGPVEVMISEGESGAEGVIIVCGGADDLFTRGNIIRAVSTILKINPNNIAIYAMNNK